MFVRAGEHDFGDFFARQFEHEVRTKPLAGNYFLSQIALGSYLPDHPDGSPPYMTATGYERTRRNLSKLTVVRGRLEDFLPTVRGIDAFFLSNVFDWAAPSEAEALGASILAARSPDAVLLYRNMLASPPLPASLARTFTPDEALSRMLHHTERSMLYRAVTAGRLG
jgi:S-adenosylmethionine:diacylglycerol 3-amino-3-carboxypropyl transferase